MLIDGQIFFALLIALTAAIFVIGLGRQLYVKFTNHKNLEEKEGSKNLFFYPNFIRLLEIIFKGFVHMYEALFLRN